MSFQERTGFSWFWKQNFIPAYICFLNINISEWEKKIWKKVWRSGHMNIFVRCFATWSYFILPTLLTFQTKTLFPGHINNPSWNGTEINEVKLDKTTAQRLGTYKDIRIYINFPHFVNFLWSKSKIIQTSWKFSSNVKFSLFG